MICKWCDGEMLTADGCTVGTLCVRKGAPAQPRIPFGEETYDSFDAVPDARCHDCGARPGQFHHPGCDVEQCPACSGQAISCECSRGHHS